MRVYDNPHKGRMDGERYYIERLVASDETCTSEKRRGRIVSMGRAACKALSFKDEGKE